MTSPAVQRQSGFSLLEILVAFSIMALSLGVLLRIFGGAGQVVSTADEYARAIVIAQSIMASAGTEKPLQPGETNGRYDESYRWTLSVEPYPVDEGQTGPFNLPFKPFWVVLNVEWGDAGDSRAFEIKTLRLLQENQSQPFGTPGDGGMPFGVPGNGG